MGKFNNRVKMKLQNNGRHNTLLFMIFNLTQNKAMPGAFGLYVPGAASRRDDEDKH